MIDLDKIAGRMLDLESKYYELQDKYQLLIHHYEDLKAEYEAYRSEQEELKRCQRTQLNTVDNISVNKD